VNDLRASLSKLRLFQFAIIASIPMFAWVAEMVSRPGSNSWTLRHWVVAAFALWTVFGGARVRGRMLARAATALAKDASELKAVKQWEAGHVLGMAFAESLALWGVVVRMVLGGALWQASLFYSVSLVLLLYWTPRLPTELA